MFIDVYVMLDGQVDNVRTENVIQGKVVKYSYVSSNHYTYKCIYCFYGLTAKMAWNKINSNYMLYF